MTPRYLEDFAAGQAFGSGRVTVETAQIKAFAAEFDPQPLVLRWVLMRASKACRGRCHGPSSISSSLWHLGRHNRHRAQCALPQNREGQRNTDRMSEELSMDGIDVLYGLALDGDQQVTHS